MTHRTPPILAESPQSRRSRKKAPAGARKRPRRRSSLPPGRASLPNRKRSVLPEKIAPREKRWRPAGFGSRSRGDLGPPPAESASRAEKGSSPASENRYRPRKVGTRRLREPSATTISAHRRASQDSRTGREASGVARNFRLRSPKRWIRRPWVASSRSGRPSRAFGWLRGPGEAIRALGSFFSRGVGSGGIGSFIERGSDGEASASFCAGSGSVFRRRGASQVFGRLSALAGGPQRLQLAFALSAKPTGRHRPANV